MRQGKISDGTKVGKFVVALAFSSVVSAIAGSKPAVTFTSPCSCEGNHGVARWVAKTDPEQPPLTTVAIQNITPAEICAWEGPGIRITTGRLPSEQKWYALNCRIENVKVEEDGEATVRVRYMDAIYAVPVSSTTPAD